MISSRMTIDHRRCDELFAESEAALTAGDWQRARERFHSFEAALARHFDAEERVLFARVESQQGAAAGPAGVMRSEHRQMRQLLRELSAAVDGRDRGASLGLAETLMMMMQQHNLKEERILYPMLDRLPPDADAELSKALEDTTA